MYCPYNLGQFIGGGFLCFCGFQVPGGGQSDHCAQNTAQEFGGEEDWDHIRLRVHGECQMGAKYGCAADDAGGADHFSTLDRKSVV